MLDLGQLEDIAHRGDHGSALSHRQAAEPKQQMRLDVVGHSRRTAELAKLVKLTSSPDNVGLHRLASCPVDGLGVEDLLESLCHTNGLLLLKSISHDFDEELHTIDCRNPLGIPGDQLVVGILRAAS